MTRTKSIRMKKVPGRPICITMEFTEDLEAELFDDLYEPSSSSHLSSGTHTAVPLSEDLRRHLLTIPPKNARDSSAKPTSSHVQVSTQRAAVSLDGPPRRPERPAQGLDKSWCASSKLSSTKSSSSFKSPASAPLPAPSLPPAPAHPWSSSAGSKPSERPSSFAGRPMSADSFSSLSLPAAPRSSVRPASSALDRPQSTDERLRAIRRENDAAQAMLQQKHANEASSRLDQALAAVFADAIAQRREKVARQRPSRSAPTEEAIVHTLLEDIYDRFSVQTSGRRVLQVSNEDLERFVKDRLTGLRTDSLQGLLVVFGLPKRPEDPTDPFDKLQMISREFSQSLDACIDETQIRTFLSLVLRGSEDTVDVEELYRALKILKGIPHLYLLEQDRRLRFQLGRVAACYVRVLVLLYHFKLDASADNAVDAALADVVLVVRILTQCIITEFPILASATLNTDESERQLNAQPGNRPLNEKASLVCRCAVEEAVAVPLYRGVIAPLFAASAKFTAKDREIYIATNRLVQETSPHELLRRLQASDPFVLESCAQPYAEVVHVLSHVWDPASEYGTGPTTKARLLVRASRTIPLAISRAGQENSDIGADDLLPIFCFATIWSRPKNLASLCYYLEQSVAESLLTSEAGYALALLQTALQTIPTLLEPDDLRSIA